MNKRGRARRFCAGKLFKLPKFPAACCAVGFFVACAGPSVGAQSPDALRVGAFSEARPGKAFPDSWAALTFEKIPRHTEYTLEEDAGVVVVKADSRASSSGMRREIRIDPKMYPRVEWRWKIGNVLERGDVTRKSGDDYPARLYITFAYDGSKLGLLERAKYKTARLIYGRYPPLGALNYIWASRSPAGTLAPNPYTARVQMLALQSGAEKAGQWVSESRNIYEDYRRAFGGEPPMISGVAVMTDTDNTGESATAWFGDIVFKAAEKNAAENSAGNSAKNSAPIPPPLPSAPATNPPTLSPSAPGSAADTRDDR
ncbi:MAG: DUF3047 domain-containing protein [Gammaproteobacteria bacterium]|nr:DUF3047 domain-containing protein [Gammaproteobacteria bacterium]CAJ2375979.1 MAG: exported hypothetical protein [Arenicellales bacterium IbO2]